MSDLVDTITEDDRWAAIGIGARAKNACTAVLVTLGHTPSAFEIALLACDDRRIATLNADFRAIERATNVLSWPAQHIEPDASGQPPPLAPPLPHETPRFLGDMAISYDTCAAEAVAQHKALSDHTTHLLVHGCLHLLGYDHGSEKQAAVMEALEVSILAKLGVANPY